MMFRALVVSALLVFTGLAEKPSPVPSQNKRQAVTAPAPQQKSGRQGTARMNEGDADRTTLSGDTGTACFYRPKAGADATMQATHATLATGTKVRVTNLANNKTAVVTISGHGDMGGRLISVSLDAAEALGFVRTGTAQVRLAVLRD
jgi:rare lipoprotein A